MSEHCYTRIRYEEGEAGGVPVWNFVKEQCLHCKEPACASACPVGALVKTKSGAVTYDFDKCIGCRYCMVACPFDIPKYEWSKSQQPWVKKCTFCAERQADNLPPACVKTCPTGALLFGEAEEVLAVAKKRLADREVQRRDLRREGGRRHLVDLHRRPAVRRTRVQHQGAEGGAAAIHVGVALEDPGGDRGLRGGARRSGLDPQPRAEGRGVAWPGNRSRR